MFLKCVHFLASYTSIVSVRAPLDRLECARRRSRLSTVDAARRDRPAELHTARASAPPARAFDERIVRPLDTALDLRPVPSSFSSSRLERESHRHHRHRVSMTLSFRRPRFGKVWEQGARVDVVVERADDFDRDRASECEIALVVQTAWMRGGKTARVGEITFDAERDDGKLTWCVPEDVPSGEYELRAHVPGAKPPIETVTRVVVAERIRVTRTSAGEARASWDARAVPTDYSTEDGWKLAIDIVPTVNEGEDVNAVVSQAFILAAESGLKTHTKDGTRILCDISDEELKTKSKILRLLPNRECQVALCAFGDESEAMPDYMTSRVPIDMSRTALEVIGGGYPSQTTSTRCVHSADGFYVRSAPPKSSDKGKDAEELKDVTNIGDRTNTDRGETSLGCWGVAESVDGWRQESGVNVLIVRADDFTPIFEHTWDTSGGTRRSKDIELALQSFMKAFFDGGAVDVARKSVPEHFLFITTCGQWSGGAPKICEKVAKTIQLVLVGILGADKNDSLAGASIQRALAAPDKPLALAALSYGNAKKKVHTWMHVAEPKAKAGIRMTLSFANGAWFPTLVQCGSGEEKADWCVPWEAYGEEGWAVVTTDSRVDRYSQLISDVRHMIFATEGAARVSVYNLVCVLIQYIMRQGGDKSLVPTVNMLLVEIVLSRGDLAAVECVNAGVIEYIIDRVMGSVRDDGSHEKLEVLDKAYMRSLLKLLTCDNFAMYAEGIRRGALEAVLRVIHAFWKGSSAYFDSYSRQMVSQLAEHVALTDLAAVPMVLKSGGNLSPFTTIRSNLTCTSQYTSSVSGQVYFLDVEMTDGQDGLIELPKKSRRSADDAGVMTPAQKILLAYDEIWEGSESPDKDADKDWTLLDSSTDKTSEIERPNEPAPLTPEPLKRTASVESDGEEQMYDGIVILSAKDANWNVHTAMIRQAPRLMWRARERGARAVVFAWPSRSPTCVPIQPLLSSPNFDNVTNIPSFVVDADSLSSISDDCELYIQLPPEGVVGAAELLASRIGDSLQDACADRPPSMRNCETPPIAGRFRGRFKPTDAQTLLPLEEVKSPETPSSSTGEGFAAALIRRVTFTQSDSVKDESGENGDDIETQRRESELAALRTLGEKVSAPLMDENSHLDSWRSASLEGVSRWTEAMRLVSALGDHGLPLLKAAYSKQRDDNAPVRILSIDGGGMRGIGTLVMLERILKATNNWCVGDCFDLIVGTSTGGIIAVGAGLLRMSTDELNELYVKMGNEIFPKKADSYMTHLYNQTTKFYQRGRDEAKNFETMLRKALREEADEPLYTIASHPRWYSSQSPPPHVCLVSHLVSRSPATTFLMRSYKHDGRGRGHLGHLPGEHRASLLNSVRATTAAPWFLEELRVRKRIGGTGGYDHDRDSDSSRSEEVNSPPRKEPPKTDERSRDARTEPKDVDAEIRLIDGAIASNNPTAVAVFEARRLFSKSRPLCVVSLGTGAAVPNSRDARLSGFPAWLDNTIHASCDVNQVDATIRHLLGTDDAYYRFQPTADIFGCELNDTTERAADELRRAAAAYMDAVEWQVHEVADALTRGRAPRGDGTDTSDATTDVASSVSDV